MPFLKILSSWLVLGIVVSPALAKTEFPGILSAPAAVLKKSQPVFQEVQIQDETSDRHSRMYLLDNVQVSIEKPATAGQTVKEALERYLQKRVALDPAGSRVLIGKLQKAEAYYILPLDEKVALDSFDMQDRSPEEREFVLELKVSFEVRDAGRVERSYLFDRKISLPDGRAEFPGQIRESYQRLTERCRKIFFETVELEFLGKLP
ncbi:MAG: hypothetical protein HY892_00160 [Deltaproteobacteria bacterium]|nr:hypothetical protein [Deltaproteobacteria bacterium]